MPVNKERWFSLSFERRRQIAEADQRMPAPRLAEQAVEQHGGQRGQRHGEGVEI
jgi:hypothetical protein